MPWASLLSAVDLWRDLLVPLDRTVTEMEHRGVHVDLGLTATLDAEAANDEELVVDELSRWYRESDAVGPEMPCNWGSPLQLQMFLHTELGLNLRPSPFWKFGQCKPGEVKTDATALKWLAGQYPEHREGINRLLEWRKITKARQYFRNIREYAQPSDTGPRIHCTFSIAGDDDSRAGAVTGRFAIKNMALTGIPIRESRYAIRDIFTAPEGEDLVIIDYSCLEVVVLAHLLIRLFGDYSLAEKIAEGTPENPTPDIHSVTASFVFDTTLGYPECRGKPLSWYKTPAGKVWRELVKAIRYGLNYGKGIWGFANTLFMPNGEPLGEERAAAMMAALFKLDPGIGQYLEWVPGFVREHRGIPSLLGRWCDLSDLVPGREWAEKRAFRRAMNYPMQAGGQEITAAAMVAIEHDPVLARLGARQILQIHDEIILRTPIGTGAEVLARAKELMLNTTRLRCGLQASGHVGPTWGAKK